MSPGRRSRDKGSPSPEAELFHALLKCVKSGDLSTALDVYESSAASPILTRLGHGSCCTLLHLISTHLDSLEPSRRTAALAAGAEIFDRMISAGHRVGEPAVSCMARIVSLGDGGPEAAFDMVKTMREKHGDAPKLRTYGPPLLGFCSRGDAVNAYEVEAHMISAGISPQEPELAALLAVSSNSANQHKVYEYLHKIRSSLDCVSESMTKIIEEWFKSEMAAEVGNENWDLDTVNAAMSVNGGGWHGTGWLGYGPWQVARANVSEVGECCCCGTRLASIDISVEDTQRFAEKVAALAMERSISEAEFKGFQEWLDNHGNFDIVVDGANIGFYYQNFGECEFSLSQLDTVVRELKGNKTSCPLVILHSKRVQDLMKNPSNKELLDTWFAEGTLYGTPYRSNDDWYWLYAAVKLKCLILTNDEMRDHIFELLGKNYFLKWKQRHQVHYTFVKGILKLVMPPPYSVAIQESDMGSWHVPLDGNYIDERQRKWLCVTRTSISSSTSAPLVAALQGMEAHQLCNNNEVSSPTNSVTGSDRHFTGKRKERTPT